MPVNLFNLPPAKPLEPLTPEQQDLINREIKISEPITPKEPGQFCGGEQLHSGLCRLRGFDATSVTIAQECLNEEICPLMSGVCRKR